MENENEAEAMRRVLEEILRNLSMPVPSLVRRSARQMEQAEDIVKLTNQLCANMPMRGRQTDTGGEGGFS